MFAQSAGGPAIIRDRSAAHERRRLPELWFRKFESAVLHSRALRTQRERVAPGPPDAAQLPRSVARGPPPEFTAGAAAVPRRKMDSEFGADWPRARYGNAGFFFRPRASSGPAPTKRNSGGARRPRTHRTHGASRRAAHFERGELGRPRGGETSEHLIINAGMV